ncbi:uncharacterized protein LOC126889295 [Diabrotica virgifera virgifera]|uniref:Sarcospan n=1 Tax=Diabrotica virgifera virgifera TaxID=50390 RepID=A0ABM5KT64_DIAVI|nr:uncharacterized protein LOC126889295 [Diabrotica virgifera virgifera]
MDNSSSNYQSPYIEIEMKDVQTRPVSFYENTKPDQLSSSNNNVSQGECPNRSQINFLNTTVPVNILAQDIAGKHTPSRNSLRHSRMIVLHKSGEAPPVIPSALQYYKIVRLLLIAILIVGLAMCILSLWLLLWTPNLRSRDNPGWSGIPVLVSSFAGILFISTIPNPKGYSGRKFRYWRKGLKWTSVTISAVAACTSFLTFVFSVLHLIVLSSMICAPPDKLVSTCLCNVNTTKLSILTDSYHYVDLSCFEVETALKILIIFSAIASCSVFLFELVYLYLHWVNRNIHEYSRVPINALQIHREHR